MEMCPGKVDARQTILLQKLHPIFSQLLTDVHDDRTLAKKLSFAKDFITTDASMKGSLPLLFDYLFYPFSFLLNGITESRKVTNNDLCRAGSPASKVPAMASALGAEKALDCFEALVDVCPAQNAVQLVALGSRLAELVHLDPQHPTVNEEMLLHTLISVSTVYRNASSALLRECMHSLQHRKSWRVSLGYTLHGLLQLVDAYSNAQKDTGSSKKQLTACVRAVRALLRALKPNPNVAAFFLPGLSSGLCRLLQHQVLQRSPVAPACTVVALGALQESVLLAFEPLLDSHQQCSSNLPPCASHESPDGCRAPGTDHNAARLSGHAALSSVVCAAQSLQAATPDMSSAFAPSSRPSGDDRVEVIRDAVWLAASEIKLSELMRPWLPALATHTSPNVRFAVASLCAGLLGGLGHCLRDEATESLLRVLLELSLDPAAKVRGPGTALLREVSQSGPSGLDNYRLRCGIPCVGGSGAGSSPGQLRLPRLVDAVLHLLPAIHAELNLAALRPEVKLRRAARTTAAALLALPPQVAASTVLLCASKRELLFAALEHCSELDAAAARLLLRQGSTGAPLLTGVAQSMSEAGTSQGDCSRSGINSPEDKAGSAGVGRAGLSLGSLSDIPPALKYVHTDEAYMALREVPRAIGALCASAWACSGDSSVWCTVLEHVRSGLAACVPGRGHRGRPAPFGPVQVGGHPYEASLLRQAVLLNLAREILIGVEEALARGSGSPGPSENPGGDCCNQGLAADNNAKGGWSAASVRECAGTVGGLDSYEGDPSDADAQMRRLAAQADEAMARDFADTWVAATAGADMVHLSECEPEEHATGTPVHLESRRNVISASARSQSSEAAAEAWSVGFWTDSALSLRGIVVASVQLGQAAHAAMVDTAAIGDDEQGLPRASHPPMCPAIASAALDLHSHSLATFTATLARRAPDALRTDDAIMRAVLLPTLEASANPHAAVALAANAALDSMCSCFNQPQLEDLLLTNADYLVDGLVAQLECPERHPGAPAMLATLLTRARITPTLLPLLSEPACCAIERLSVSARAARPQHTRAFLHLLAPLMRAARALGSALDAQSSAQAEVVQRRLQAQLTAADSLCVTSAGCHSTLRDPSSVVEGAIRPSDAMAHLTIEQPGYREGKAEPENAAQPFFEKHHQEKNAKEAAGRVHLAPVEREQFDVRRSQTCAAMELAAAVAKASAPLLLSEFLPLCMAAYATVTEALRALVPLTSTFDRDTSAISEVLAVEAASLPAEPERLLPVVHIVWGFAASGLAHVAVSVQRTEAAASLLAELAIVSGSFISRRLRERVLPEVCRLLSSAALRRAPEMGIIEDGAAPASVARARTAVLGMLARAGADQFGRHALQGSAYELAHAILPHIGCTFCGTEVDMAAEAAMLALACVDTDAVWLVLFSAVHHAKGSGMGSWKPPVLPCVPSSARDAQPICFPPAADVGVPTVRWAHACARLLARVEAMAPSWHSSFGAATKRE